MTRLFFTLFLATLPISAGAEELCASRDDVLRSLTEKYGESRQGVGLAHNRALMELFASSETGSWTITVTTPDGKTCLVATGQNFAVVERKVEGESI